MAFAFIGLGTSDVVKSLWNPTHGLTVTKCGPKESLPRTACAEIRGFCISTIKRDLTHTAVRAFSHWSLINYHNKYAPPQSRTTAHWSTATTQHPTLPRHTSGSTVHLATQGCVHQNHAVRPLKPSSFAYFASSFLIISRWIVS
jgi:hypothetical protein